MVVMPLVMLQVAVTMVAAAKLPPGLSPSQPARAPVPWVAVGRAVMPLMLGMVGKVAAGLLLPVESLAYPVGASSPGVTV